jgi:hypothetical protein
MRPVLLPVRPLTARCCSTNHLHAACTHPQLAAPCHVQAPPAIYRCRLQAPTAWPLSPTPTSWLQHPQHPSEYGQAAHDWHSTAEDSWRKCYALLPPCNASCQLQHAISACASNERCIVSSALNHQSLYTLLPFTRITQGCNNESAQNNWRACQGRQAPCYASRRLGF